MFSADPTYTDHYECGNVELRVHTWVEEPIRREFWLKVGICSLQFKDGDFDALLEIMDQYYDQNIEEDNGE